MSKKEISIIIRAKNAMSAGLAKAGAALKNFGQSALRIGKAFAASFTAAGAAIGGFAVKAISSYAEQEKAEAALTASLNAYGETAAGIVPKLKKVAEAIQDETGAADESTLAGMAKLKMLGVQTSKLEEAAKATIALSSVGLKGESAQRAVALAMQGNYDMLNRYVPAIRNATSEQEKAAAFNDLVSRGYEQQKDVLNTTSGAWNALKGRVGDAWEEAGKAIEQYSSLTTVLQKVGDKVKELTQRFSDWAAKGGMVDVVAGIKVFAAEAIYRFKSVGLGFELIWAIAKDATKTGINYITNFVKAFADQTIESFKMVGAWASAAWDKIKSPTSEFKPPDTTAYEAAVQRMADAMLGKDALVTESSEKTLRKIESLNVAHLNNIERLESDHLKAKEDFAKKKAEAEKAALEAERLEAQNAEKRKIEDAKKAAMEKAKAAKAAQEKLAEVESERAEPVTDTDQDEEGPSTAKRRTSPLTLAERAKIRRTGGTVGQLAERSNERMFALWGRAKTAQDSMIERALEDGKKGIKGAHIERAKEIQKAREQVSKEEDRLKQAEEARATLEKELADATKRTADAAETIVDTLEESLKPA